MDGADDLQVRVVFGMHFSPRSSIINEKPLER